MDCRLEMIREGKEAIPRSCQLCGLFNRCQKFLDQPHPPKPTAEDTVKAQAAEIERLTRVANQSRQFIKSVIGLEDLLERERSEYPELYAHLGGGK